MATKENAVVATAPAKAKDEVRKCTIKSIDADIQTNINGKRYLKCTLITASGKLARGIIHEVVWDKVSVADEVNVALSLTADGSIIPSVLGLPIPPLTMDDFGVAPDFKVG